MVFTCFSSKHLVKTKKGGNRTTLGMLLRVRSNIHLLIRREINRETQKKRQQQRRGAGTVHP